MNLRSMLTLVVLAACAGLPGCGDGRGTDEGVEGFRLTANCSRLVSHAPLMIAAEEGYFREQGLDVEFVQLKRSVAGLPALAQGRLDVLSGAVNAGLLNTMARGADVRIVADKGHIARSGPPFTGIVLRRALAAGGAPGDASRLRGLSLATNKDNMAALFSDRSLARVGLTLEEMYVHDVPNPAQADALVNNALDLIQASEPWLTRLMDTGEAVLWAADYEVIPGFQYSYVAFGPSLLRERPEAGRRFIVAYLRAVRQYCRGKTERNVEILARHTGLEPEMLRRTGWPAISPDGRINVQSIMDFQEWAAARELLERRLGPDEFWEPAFVQFANGTTAEKGRTGP